MSQGCRASCRGDVARFCTKIGAVTNHESQIRIRAPPAGAKRANAADQEKYLRFPSNPPARRCLNPALISFCLLLRPTCLNSAARTLRPFLWRHPRSAHRPANLAAFLPDLCEVLAEFRWNSPFTHACILYVSSFRNQGKLSLDIRMPLTYN